MYVSSCSVIFAMTLYDGQYVYTFELPSIFVLYTRSWSLVLLFVGKIHTTNVSSLL